MKIETFEILGPKLINPIIHDDNRGYFFEAFKEDWFSQNVENVNFVQDNQSYSKEIGTIRGLHYQSEPFKQGKLVRVLSGAIFDVAIDIRKNSKTFGKWIGVELSAQNKKQLWIPKGFAHGFCTISADTEILYKVTAPYSNEHDYGIAFDDKELAINWPIDIKNAIVSDKDKAQPRFASLK